MLSRLAGLTAALAVAASVAATVAAAAAPKTPAALYEAIRAAGRTQRSVHYVSSSVTPKSSVSIDGQAAVTHGVQQITFRKGSKTGHATVLVIAKTAYLRGDAFTLRNYMGFNAAASSRYGNHWIVIPGKHRLFAPVAAAVTLASAIDQLGPKAGTLTRIGPATVGGTRVVGVRARRTVGKTTQVDTLYGRAKGAPLPVREVATEGPAYRFTLSFDRWNAALHLAAPKHPVSIAKVESASGGPVA